MIAWHAVRIGRSSWLALVSLALLIGVLTFACVTTPLAPAPGLRESEEPARLAVPGGLVNLAGGNFFTERSDLALDTRLGPFAVGASYNSASGWLWSFDVTYQGGALRDASGALIDLSALADGAAAPGTHWVRVDATRAKTKGGLLHEFDPATGRLLVVRFTSAAYPRLRFAQTAFGAVWRTTAIDQCTGASACTSLFTLAYDASARLVRLADVAGRSAEFDYDAEGRLASARGALDVANGWPGTRYEYANGFLRAIASSHGERVEIASDAAGRATQVRAIGAGDPTWSFAYGLPSASIYTTTMRDPLGNATALEIDGARLVRSRIDALGQVTRYAWAAGRMTSLATPDGALTTWTYAGDDVATRADASGNVTTFSYRADAVNREDLRARPILAIADSLGAVESRSYDAAGRLLTVANGAGERTTFTWGADEAVLRVQAPDGAVVTFAQYGAHGHPRLISADEQSWAVAEYDAAGHRLRTSWPGPESGGVQRLAYDASGAVAAIELLDAPIGGAPSAQAIAIENRADGRPLRVRRPYGGDARFGYDALGRLTTIAELASPTESADPTAFSVTTYAYDALDRVTAVERANGMREEREYDALGRLVRLRALRGGVAESDVRFEYAADRLVRAFDAASGFEERYAYDAAGRVGEVTHALGEKTRFAYDLRSRPERTELALPDGSPLAAFTHAYDVADRETRLGYLGADLVVRSYVGGRLEETAYANGLRRRQFRDMRSGRASGRELWRGGTRLERSDYTARPTLGGEVTLLRTEVGGASPGAGITKEEFTYASSAAPPGLDRRVVAAVSTLNGSASSEQLAYDALSNLTRIDRTAPILDVTVTSSALLVYNAERNRLLRADATGFSSSFAYDAAGFVLQQATALGTANTVTRFDWNARGQIAAISTDGVPSATFAYDALGRRRERFANGELLRWRFGGLVEADANDRPVAIDLGEVRVQLDGQHRFRHTDLRGNTKLVSDMTGSVETQNVFSAYGPSGALGVAAASHGFASGDAISVAGGLVLLGARLYAPAFGRFLSPDPVWSPINQFTYTLGNPVDFWDVTGMHSGSHADLTQANLMLVAKMFAFGFAVGALVVVAGPAATIAAAGAVVGAGFLLIDAFIEADQLDREHAALTEHEARQRDSREPTGNTGSQSGFEPVSGAGEPATGVVCSNDGSGDYCTRGRTSGVRYGRSHIWIY